MIRQNINLLDLLKGNKRDKYNFSIEKFILVNIFFNFIMIVIVMAYLFQWLQLSGKTVTLSNQLVAQVKILSELKSHFPANYFETQSSDLAGKLHQEISVSHQLLDELEGNISFSDTLKSLSNDIVPQVWLTKINVINQGDDITLNGKSYSERQLEKFIYNISKDKSFSRYVLNVNRLERISEKKDTVIIDFEIKLSEKSLS